MRVTNPLALVALMLLALAGRDAAADDLFSEVAVESVFASPTSENEAKSPSTARVTGALQLAELVRDSGLEPKRVDAKTVSLELEHAGWSLPAVVKAAVDRQQIDLVVSLRTLAGGEKLDSERMLSLLAAEPDASGAYFAFDSNRRRIELRRAIGARGLTSRRLSSALREMAEMAVSRQSAWAKTTASAGKAPPASTASTTPLPIGSWVAKRGSREAFAIRLTAEGRFTLAHVRGGKTTRSTGTASLNGSELTLSGDGQTTLRATLSRRTASGFRLKIGRGRTLSFRKAG